MSGCGFVLVHAVALEVRRGHQVPGVGVRTRCEHGMYVLGTELFLVGAIRS